MMSVRRTIRVKAFQALFQLTKNFRTTPEQAIKYAITYPLTVDEEEELDELEALKLVLPNGKIDDEKAADNLAYLKDLVMGVKEHQDFLDEQLENQLTNWTLQRIELTNLLILRIASYELYYHEETDPRIVINEAIEMTKAFNNDDASKFVNGVLQGILDAKGA